MDRVPGYEPGGWGFDSLRMYQVKGVDLVNYAYVTLATNENYLLLAMYLQASLRIQKSQYPLIVMITDNLKDRVNELTYLDKYEIIPHYQFSNAGKKYLDTINKFYAYNFIQYDRLIWIDADVLLLENIDKLFSLAPNFVCSTYSLREKYKKSDDNTIVCPHNVIMLFTPDKDIYNLVLSYKDLCLADEDVVKDILYPEYFKTLHWDDKCNTFENLHIDLNVPIFIHSKKLQTGIISSLRITPQKLEKFNMSQQTFFQFLVGVYQTLIKQSAGLLIAPQAIIDFLIEHGSLKHHCSVGF